MQIIKLPEPELRKGEVCFDSILYRSKAPQYLSTPGDPPRVEFFTVLERRQTNRTFGRVDDTSLAVLLWSVAKTRRTFREPSGHLWQHRSTPSAGGRHPIDLLIIPPIQKNARAYLYDPMGHSLHEIPQNESTIRVFHAELQNVLETGEGTVIWFVADYRRALAKYIHPESLIWRDAGVLLGSICFVAEALELNCCPYGLNGEAFISEVFGDALLVGAGGCVVGSRG
jgi:SagB-type dehydrogenase family enzyme